MIKWKIFIVFIILFSLVSVTAESSNGAYSNWSPWWVIRQLDTDEEFSIDTEPPAKVDNLRIEKLNNRFFITWNESIDNVGIDYYNIYRDNFVIYNTSNISFLDTDVIKNTVYTYQISAVDTSGNEGELSDPVDVKLKRQRGGYSSSDNTEIEKIEDIEEIEINKIFLNVSRIFNDMQILGITFTVWLLLRFIGLI